MILGDVSYHDYHGIALTDEEKDALQKSIGPYNKVSFDTVHSMLTMSNVVLVGVDAKSLWPVMRAFDILKSLVVVFFQSLQCRVYAVHDRR